MSKSLQYVKIFELLQNAKAPVPVSAVKAIDGIVATRLSTYMWEIKKNTGFAVRANRDGRSVVSYELVGSGTAPVVKPVKVATPKVAKATKTVAPKAKALAKTKPAKVAGDSLDVIMTKMVKSAGVVDVLDAMDTDIEDYEDRSFAADYVRGAI